MKRSIYTVSLLGLSLFVGSACNTRKQLHERAHEQRQEAQQAEVKADEEAREARQTERQAAQAQPGNTPETVRQPVAGREPIMVLEESVRGELGHDWTVTRTNDTVGATRKTMKTPARALSQKVNDKIHALHNDHKDLLIDVRRPDTVTIHGNIADCEDAANVAESFAKLNGINQINVRVNCLSK